MLPDFSLQFLYIPLISLTIFAGNDSTLIKSILINRPISYELLYYNLKASYLITQLIAILGQVYWDVILLK